MLKSILLAFGIATATLLSLSESRSVEDVESSIILKKILSQVQALKYGDECSWDVEEIRQNYTRHGLSGETTSFQELMIKIVQNDWKLCSATELFVCDKESQKCVCGDPGYESQFGVERDLYTLEENQKCRWNTDTYCVPAEFMTSLHVPGLKIGSSCRSGTSCTARDGTTCSKQGMLSYLLNTYDQEFFTDPAKVSKVLASGEICSCKQDKEGPSKVEATRPDDYSTENEHENSVYQVPSTDSDKEDKPPTLYRIHLMGEEDETTDGSTNGRGRRSASSSGDELDLGSLVKYVAGASVTPDW